MTAEKPTVVEAFAAVQAEILAVGKDGKNTQQNYNFRGIDAVVNAVGPVLREQGVIAAPVAVDSRYRDVQTSQGKPSRECTVTVTYRFYGPAGDFIDVQVPGESMDFGDKGAAKAMSVAFRIALLQALCIPTDEPEPDAATYERAAEAVVTTDPGWLDKVTSKIDAAGNETELAAVEAEIGVRYHNGGVAESDAQNLRGLLNNRRAELHAPVGASA